MLLKFLTDIVSNMDTFRDDLTTVYLYYDADKLLATANHPKRLLFYKVTPKNDLTGELQAPAYLGGLTYLRPLLSSALMREEPRIELVYREHDGKKHCVETMKFIAKRFQSNFQCTNPNILNDKDRLKQFTRPDDAIFFPFDKAIYKDFLDVARFNTPKADTRLFTLSYDGGYVRAIFGTGSHTSTLVLASEVTGQTEQKFSRLVSLDRFRGMVKLTAEHRDGRVGFHPQAFWVDFESEHAAHMVVTPTIREQTH